MPFIRYTSEYKMLESRVYKNNLDFGVTRVQSDYSVRGSEFVDLIATILTARIVKLWSANLV